VYVEAIINSPNFVIYIGYLVLSQT
jgi:hypothetical protein